MMNDKQTTIRPGDVLEDTNTNTKHTVHNIGNLYHDGKHQLVFDTEHGKVTETELNQHFKVLKKGH